MEQALLEQIDKIVESFNGSGSSEGVAVAVHLETLTQLELEKGEEKECVVDSLRELINWAECAISRLTHCSGPCTAGLMPGESCEVCRKVADIADMMQGQGGCTG